MNSLRGFDAIWQDLKYGLRQLRLKPGFTLTAVLSLALGIGANTAVFTLLDQILLRMLPVKNPRELVQLEVTGGRFGSNDGDDEHTFSHPLYLAFRDRNTVFSGITGQQIEEAGLSAGDRVESIRVGFVAGNYFNVLGVQPGLGRLLTSEDSRTANSQPVAVLQYDYWRTRFNGEANVLGSTIRLGGAPFTVIGVSAAGFDGTDVAVPTQAWVPITMKPAIVPTWNELENERSTWFYLFARLKPGVTREQAQAAMRVLYRQRQTEELQAGFFQQHPETRDQFLRQNFTLIPGARGQSGLRSQIGEPLLVLQWLVGVVLLIACANVANLLLARASARAREIAIRGALGASRGQLVRQLLIESLLLAAAGGVAGLLFSSWLARAMLSFLSFDPANLTLTTTPDLRILLFTAAATLFTAILFGMVPALQGSRTPPADTLKGEAGSIAGGSPQARLRKAFVTVQVGLSCLLLIGAGLFVRTLDNLRRVDLGFHTENVAMFSVRPASVYDAARKLDLYRTLMERLSAVPGVKAVGANRVQLLTGGVWDGEISMPGVEAKEANQPRSLFNAITPGYFEALGIPVKAGRDLRWSDWGGSRKLCLVNEELVRQYLGGTSPVGRLMTRGFKRAQTEIVGVTGNARYEDVRGETQAQTFISMDLIVANVDSINVYARIQGDPRQILPQLRAKVGQVDPNLVVSGMRTLDDQLNMRLSNERMLSFLSVAFALLATLLAVVGMHGVLAFVVARRSHEIGIRMALGAGRSSVVRLVLREMLLSILVGLAAGVGAGLLCGRYMESQLFGMTATDPLMFAIGIGAVLASSLAAAIIPSWRASRIDPTRALRWGML
jgi:predicted permease